jgi:hypothetical protein
MRQARQGCREVKIFPCPLVTPAASYARKMPIHLVAAHCSATFLDELRAQPPKSYLDGRLSRLSGTGEAATEPAPCKAWSG